YDGKQTIGRNYRHRTARQAQSADLWPLGSDRSAAPCILVALGGLSGAYVRNRAPGGFRRGRPIDVFCGHPRTHGYLLHRDADRGELFVAGTSAVYDRPARDKLSRLANGRPDFVVYNALHRAAQRSGILPGKDRDARAVDLLRGRVYHFGRDDDARPYLFPIGRSARAAGAADHRRKQYRDPACGTACGEAVRTAADARAAPLYGRELRRSSYSSRTYRGIHRIGPGYDRSCRSDLRF